MLVLSRKQGQSIRVAPGITITVQQISGSRVILGFDAPSDVRIVRQEIREADPHNTTQRAIAAAPFASASHEAGHDYPTTNSH